ncbi:hypothetical protein MHYMCMPSP_00186 [Hyalomma marginatum]|uniref:Uncharacterized protein n=1 Tax=Hyalomma marginatum TaxID=34627 RepID=A0A8S4C3U4_9ACAR|nr:hypothetical protein MHYMCMPSP_00186 [Hyalomma marginatum]CAG7592046.1 hypothetical protein MHYMCMPASI_00518 [Hyalomma marginatum]
MLNALRLPFQLHWQALVLRGPVVVSMPELGLYSGCPGVFEWICLKYFRSSMENVSLKKRAA